MLYSLQNAGSTAYETAKEAITMAETPALPTIDMAAIQAEVAKLAPSALQESLGKMQLRKKVQQLKHQGSDAQKLYQQKQRARYKAMKEQAIATPATQPGFANLWEQINAAALAQAEEQVGTGAEDEAPEAEPTA